MNLAGGMTPRDYDEVERRVICFFAETIAEHRFTGRRNRICASSDYKNVVDLLFNIWLAGTTLNSYRYEPRRC